MSVPSDIITYDYQRIFVVANRTNSKWWEMDLNHRHMSFQPIALPTELSHHFLVFPSVNQSIDLYLSIGYGINQLQT